VAIFASPAVLIDGRSRGRKPWIAPVAALLVLVAMGIFGAVRLSQEPTRTVANVKLRIMQPNLQQDVKFNYGRQDGSHAEISWRWSDSGVRAAIDRRARRQHSDLAGIGVPVFPDTAKPT